ncbi:MAG: hypothetical protein ACRC8Y_25010, partial [Chroococcales cyanobacterium]
GCFYCRRWGGWGRWGRMFVVVCSNDFSRCSRVMASAMTRAMSGLSAWEGTGGSADGCVTWRMPSNADND